MEMMQMDLGDAMADSDSDTTVDTSGRQPSGMDTPPPREASPSLPQMEGYNPSDSFSDSSSNLLKSGFATAPDDIAKGNVIDFSSLENSGGALIIPDTGGGSRRSASVLDSLLDQKLRQMGRKDKSGVRLRRNQIIDDDVDGDTEDEELDDSEDDDEDDEEEGVVHAQVDKEGSECNSEEIMDFGEDEPLPMYDEDDGTAYEVISDPNISSSPSEHFLKPQKSRSKDFLKKRFKLKMEVEDFSKFDMADISEEAMQSLAEDRLPSECDSDTVEEDDYEGLIKLKKKLDEEERAKSQDGGDDDEDESDDGDDDDDTDDDDDEYEVCEEEELNEEIDSLLKGDKGADGDREDGPPKKKRKRIIKKRKKKYKKKDGDSDSESEDGKSKKKRKKDKDKDGKEKKDEKDADEKEKKKDGQRKNIRKIISEDQLESATKSAQQEEMERKQRILEQRERLAQQQRVLEEGRSELKSLLEDAESDQKDDDIIEVSSKQGKEEKEKTKGGKDDDVITLSSSDDDCKVVPSEPEEEDDDPDNSGLHIRDDLNTLDEEGRVVVNVGHPDEDEDIFLAPQLSAAVKPHQIGGIRFLYDNLVESIARYKSSNGFGCILAHSMGLGKTIQLISFIDIFLRCTPGKSVLVIVPVNTLQNWLHEFDMWLPHKDSDTIKHAPPEMIQARTFEVHYINDSHKSATARADVVTKWVKEGGVLLMGYEMYRLLTSKRTLQPKAKKKKNDVIDVEEEDKNKERLAKIQEALLKPGPDLVICDEGHRIKNSHASISQALKNLKTKRRVVLTGYPLQNNLMEYWCMVDFVRPNYLGTKTEFSNMFERPIMNGQCADSTPQDRKLMRYRSHVLFSLLSGFVQRRGHTVLKKALPPKQEHVILVRMSPIQRKLYKAFMDSLQKEDEEESISANPLKAFSVCCKIWNHPDVLYKVMQAKKQAIEDDLEIGDDIAPTTTNKKRGKKTSRSSGASTPAQTPPLVPPPNPMSQFGPIGGMGGRMNTPPWNQGMGGYGGPNNQGGMYGMGPPGNMGPMGMGPPMGPGQMNMGERGGHMGYGPGGMMNMGPNMGLNGPMNMGNPNMGPPNMNMGQQSMDQNNSGGNMNMGPNGPMGINQPNMAQNNSQNMGSNGPQNMGTNGPNGPTGNQNMGNNGAPGMGQMGPNPNNPGMGPNGPQNTDSNSQQNMGQSNSSMGPNTPQNMGGNQQGPQTASQGMTSNDSQNIPTGRGQNMGQGSQNMPNGPQNMGPNGPQNIGPNGGQNMGPNGPQNVGGPNNSQNIGPNGPQGMGPNGPQGMGQNMGMNMNQNGPMGMSPNGQQGMGPYGQMGPYNQQMGPYNQGPMGMYGQPPMGGYNQQMGPYGQNNMMQNQPMGQNHPMGPMGAPRPGMDMSGQSIGPSGPYYGGPHNMNMHGPNKSMSGPMDNQNQSGMGAISGAPGSQGGLGGQSGPSGPGELQAPRHYGHYPSTPTTPNTPADKSNPDASGKSPSATETEGQQTGAGSPPEDNDAKPKTEDGKPEEDAKDPPKKEVNEISYKWAEEIMETYKRGMMENGGKIVLLMALIEETLKAGDKLLVFSQSLFTLNIIEEYLQQSRVPLPYCNEYWQRNRSYFRLDGSTSGIERERLISQFNAYNNNQVHVFLLSTRAGCLGINLIGANRVVVLDASWNPCHDAQAVCRVYRYGQQKPCFVYRFVTDNTLEKKIYDRQINKQGMSDRVVDELQPQTNFTKNQVDTLLDYDDKEFEPIKPDDESVESLTDLMLKDLMKQYHTWITKAPFTHESLLIDRKEEKMTKMEKRLAKQGYEMEKKMNISYTRPSYAAFYGKNDSMHRQPAARQVTIVYKKTANGEVKQVICIPTRQPQIGNRPIASVRPMMSTPVAVAPRPAPAAGQQPGNIPVSSLLRPGVTVHQIQTTTDINIPSNAANNTGPQKIPAGETVLVIKTPKGVYIRTNNGKIFAVRSAPKGAETTPAGLTPGVAMTSALKTATTTTTSSPILQRTLTKQGAPGEPNKVTTLSSKSVTDLLSGGSLLANQRKDGTKIISREKMQTLLQQGKIVNPKGMPITLIRSNNPNPNMQYITKVGGPGVAGKVPAGVRIIRPDKFASVQIAKAAAAAKAGGPNVDTKKEAAAIVADVLARYNENQVVQGGNPILKNMKRDDVKTALIKDADGKLILKTIPQGMNIKPQLKDEVKPQLLKDIEMVKEKELAKGQLLKALSENAEDKPSADIHLGGGDAKGNEEQMKKTNMDISEKGESADIVGKESQGDIESLSTKENQKDMDTKERQAKEGGSMVNKENEMRKDDSLNKDTSAGIPQEQNTVDSWNPSNMFSGRMDPNPIPNFSSSNRNTTSNNNNNNSQFTSVGANGSSSGNFGGAGQFGMAQNSSGNMDSRNSSQFDNPFIPNQEYMGRPNSSSSSGSSQNMGNSQFNIGGSSGNMNNMNYPMNSGQNSMDNNQFSMRNQFNNSSMGNMNQMNMSNNIDNRQPGMMGSNVQPPTTGTNQPSGMNQSSSLNSQFNMGGPQSANMNSQSNMNNQNNMSGQFNNMGRDSIDKINSPTRMNTQFGMGNQPNMSRTEMGNSTQTSSMGSGSSMGSPQNIVSTPSMGNSQQHSMRSTPSMGSSHNMSGSQGGMGSSQSMGNTSQSQSSSQSNSGRSSRMDNQYPDMGRSARDSGSHFSMSSSSRSSSQQQAINMPSESSKRNDMPSVPHDQKRSSSSTSSSSTSQHQHQTSSSSENRRMPTPKESTSSSPDKRHDSSSSSKSAEHSSSDRNARPSSASSSKPETSQSSSSRPSDWPTSQASMNTTKPGESASSLLKDLVPPSQPSDHPPSYPGFSSSMTSPYGSTPGYSMPPMYPSHMGHSSSYGMSHGLSPWYSGLPSPWSAPPPSYPSMTPSDPYAKHMPGSTPSMSSYPGMSGYSGYGNTPGMNSMPSSTPSKEKEPEKDRLNLSAPRHSGKEGLDVPGSAFDMQSANPLSAMSAMSGMSSMGSGHTPAIGNPYHQSGHGMQSAGGMGSYGAYPYHHMSPLSHPAMYPPPGGSSYNYMSPYSSMPGAMMQHLPGSMPPLHPLSDMDPSRPPHMAP